MIDVDKWQGCDALLDGNRKIACSMVNGDGHGPEHKRITKTGRVTHRWPAPEYVATQAPRDGEQKKVT